jgi:hypothetical protein
MTGPGIAAIGESVAARGLALAPAADDTAATVAV